MTLNDIARLEPALFNDFRVPVGLKREDVVNTIMVRCGLLRPLYPEPETFKALINIWFVQKAYTFDKLVETMSLEYNPLENYDRMEDWTDNTVGQSTNNIENKVSAYNTDSYQPNNTSDATNNGTSNSTHKGRVHGNIGVTTSQQMLQAQRDVVQFDVYETIAEMFEQKFLIGLY